MAMDSGTYVITLDLLDPTLDLEGLNNFIKTSSMFENWWNHIPGVFLVVSRQDAAAISNAVRPFTKSARLLVIRTSPDDSEGLLSDRAWKWVKRRAHETAERSAAE
jgi:hypothetical protein